MPASHAEHGRLSHSRTADVLACYRAAPVRVDLSEEARRAQASRVSGGRLREYRACTARELLRTLTTSTTRQT
ncbi:hypothetical protein SAMN04487820_112134 [Actinopolyspora mzabensis]|uniref:Uncharacterized protein n=1 Tax=Actinopolyspora mzabensis TaxID=995066 RepID=A0A1G9ELP1_ACTMZ|nr:hypothetical protein [Actinopolyspora mzabensis]SDK77070.1 hypothetical protein SAMN04487820_112134 [Actinopolyspora mzabensis]